MASGTACCQRVDAGRGALHPPPYPVVSAQRVLNGIDVRGRMDHRGQNVLMTSKRALAFIRKHGLVRPALVRAAGRLPSARLSQVREVHTASGRHVTREVPFPDWVPSTVRAAARTLPE